MTNQNGQSPSYDALKTGMICRLFTEPPFQHRLALRPLGHGLSANTVVCTVMAAVVADASSQ